MDNLDSLRDAINDAFERARDHRFNMEQAAPIFEDERDDPLYLYRKIQDILENAMIDATRLLHHTHEWNEDGFCFVCGYDGNA